MHPGRKEKKGGGNNRVKQKGIHLRSSKAADHEAEVASVGGGGHCMSSHNDGHVRQEDPIPLDKSGWEAEHCADQGRSSGDDSMVWAVIHVARQRA